MAATRSCWRPYQGGSKGVASRLVHLSNKLYLERTRAEFSTTRALALQWDAGAYAGLNVNIGLAIDVGTGCGAHLVPQVPPLARRAHDMIV